MKIIHDKKIDAIYIMFQDIPYAYGRNLGEERRIDYGGNDEVRGVELHCISHGVITNDLPHRGEIERLLEERHIPLPA